jgi:hypothetical protein
MFPNRTVVSDSSENRQEGNGVGRRWDTDMYYDGRAGQVFENVSRRLGENPARRMVTSWRE